MTAAGPRALHEAVHCAVRRAGTVDSRLPSSQDCPIAGISRGARPASGRRVPREPHVMSLGFVHLHLHSAYSLLEGALPIARLAELAKADRQAGGGAHRYQQHVRGAGILRQDGGRRHPADHRLHAVGRLRRPGPPSAPCRARRACPQSLPRLVLLAATEAGYRNLLHLSSRAFLDHPGTEPAHIKLGWLDGHADGLIALTGGPDGPSSTAPSCPDSPILSRRAPTRCCACSATGSMWSCSGTAPPTSARSNRR